MRDTISTADSARVSRTPVDWVAGILVVIGGLNWGLVGFFNFDLVAAIFGTMSPVARIVYDLVGLAALYFLVRGFVPSRRSKVVTR